jgi:hypothetical protein
MSKGIPRKDFFFHLFQMALVLFVTPKIAQLLIDKIWFNEIFLPAQKAWDDAWKAYQDLAMRTRAVTNRKNTARKTYQPLLAKLIAMLKADPGVTDETLHNLNISTGKGGGHPKSEKPTEIPHYNIYTGLIRHILIYFGLTGKHLVLRGRPSGVRGAEIRWGILDTPPTGIGDLHESMFRTESPFDFEFKEEDRGKIFYFCIRWENTTGETGPESEIVGVRIP